MMVGQLMMAPAPAIPTQFPPVMAQVLNSSAALGSGRGAGEQQQQQQQQQQQTMQLQDTVQYQQLQLQQTAQSGQQFASFAETAPWGSMATPQTEYGRPMQSLIVPQSQFQQIPAFQQQPPTFQQNSEPWGSMAPPQTNYSMAPGGSMAPPQQPPTFQQNSEPWGSMAPPQTNYGAAPPQTNYGAAPGGSMGGSVSNTPPAGGAGGRSAQDYPSMRYNHPGNLGEQMLNPIVF